MRKFAYGDQIIEASTMKEAIEKVEALKHEGALDLDTRIKKYEKMASAHGFEFSAKKKNDELATVTVAGQAFTMTVELTGRAGSGDTGTVTFRPNGRQSLTAKYGTSLEDAMKMLKTCDAFFITSH